MNSEQSFVTFRVPNFVDSDGIEYTDIEVIVEMDGDIYETAQLVKTLEHPLAKGWRNVHRLQGAEVVLAEFRALQGNVGQNHQTGTYKR